jgi:hypothetical protein
MALRLISLPISRSLPVTNFNIKARPSLPQIYRTMATAAQTYEWIVMVPDFPGVQEKRLAVRSYAIP